MKIQYLLSLAGLLLLTACGEEQSVPAEPVSADAVQEKPAPVPRKKIVLPGLENGVLKLQEDPADEQKRTEKKEILSDTRQIHYWEPSQVQGDFHLPGGGQRTNRKQTWHKETPVMPSSWAAEIPSDHRLIQWIPQIRQGESIGSRLQDAVLSADQSVFVFVERTGEQQGPYGSRIILLNACTWRIMKIFEIPRKINRIVLSGTGHYVIALCGEQEDMKQRYGLSVIRLDTGKEQQFTPLHKSLNGSFLCDRDNYIYIASTAKNEIAVYSAGKISGEPEILKTAAPDVALALSPDGKRVAAANRNGSIEFFKTADRRLLQTEKLASAYPVRQLVFLDNSRNFICAPDVLSDRSSIVYRDRQVFELNGRSGGWNGLSGDGQHILHLKKVNGEIEYVNAVTLQKEKSVIPEQIQPRTGSDPFRVFYLDVTDITAVLDQRGNFYLLHLPEGAKKFQKETIFMTGK